ncbi:MAG: HIT family protein [Pseudomonadota bacterium]|jgi:histidine triad (HIT) family protein
MTPPQFALPDYQSPFNLFLRGVEVAPVESRRGDVIYESEHVLGMVCSRQIPGHEGHSLVISKVQYQSILDLPVNIGQEVFAATKLVSQALVSALGCDGVMIIQNNGQASDQTVFHYHVHVVPRWNGDKFLDLYATHSETQKLVPVGKRAEIGLALRMEIERIRMDNDDAQRSSAR